MDFESSDYFFKRMALKKTSPRVQLAAENYVSTPIWSRRIQFQFFLKKVPRVGAVRILIYPEVMTSFFFPFDPKRPYISGVHSGQIAFREEKMEQMISRYFLHACCSLKLGGKLGVLPKDSELPWSDFRACSFQRVIFLVSPYYGLVERNPEFCARNLKRAIRIIELPSKQLLDLETRKQKNIRNRWAFQILDIQYFDISNR